MEEGFDPVPVAVESTDPTTTSRDGAAAAAGPHEQELEAPADGGGGGGRALVATTTTTTTTSDAAASAVPASGGGANPVQLSTDRRIATGTSALSDRPEGPSPLQDRPLYSPLSPTARAAMLFRSFIDAAGTFSDAVPSPIASIVAKQRSEILASALRAAAAAQPKSTSGSPSQPKAKGIAAATAGDERLSSSSSSGRKVETVWDSEDYEALAIVRAMAEQAKELERILAESIGETISICVSIVRGGSSTPDALFVDINALIREERNCFRLGREQVVPVHQAIDRRPQRRRGVRVSHRRLHDRWWFTSLSLF
ncbi:hypothetical protein DFJ73DRAFT_517026 [Zopfochytrium polystomum]|nr:hypothetical protein DFJ73DRAFT_517026 [Zopfochytrium polystomum]